MAQPVVSMRASQSGNRRVSCGLRSRAAGRSAQRTSATYLVMVRVRELTRLELIADYHLTMGPVGPVVDSETMQEHVISMLETTLRGLRTFLQCRIKEDAHD